MPSFHPIGRLHVGWRAHTLRSSLKVIVRRVLGNLMRLSEVRRILTAASIGTVLVVALISCGSDSGGAGRAVHKYESAPEPQWVVEGNFIELGFEDKAKGARARVIETPDVYLARMPAGVVGLSKQHGQILWTVEGPQYCTEPVGTKVYCMDGDAVETYFGSTVVELDTSVGEITQSQKLRVNSISAKDGAVFVANGFDLYRLNASNLSEVVWEKTGAVDGAAATLYASGTLVQWNGDFYNTDTGKFVTEAMDPTPVDGVFYRSDGNDRAGSLYDASGAAILPEFKKNPFVPNTELAFNCTDREPYLFGLVGDLGRNVSRQPVVFDTTVGEFLSTNAEEWNPFRGPSGYGIFSDELVVGGKDPVVGAGVRTKRESWTADVGDSVVIGSDCSSIFVANGSLKALSPGSGGELWYLDPPVPHGDFEMVGDRIMFAGRSGAAVY